jgi:hypothetical protein
MVLDENFCVVFIAASLFSHSWRHPPYDVANVIGDKQGAPPVYRNSNRTAQPSGKKHKDEPILAFVSVGLDSFNACVVSDRRDDS